MSKNAIHAFLYGAPGPPKASKESPLKWELEARGVLRLQDTKFTVVWDGPGEPYQVFYGEKKIGFSHSLSNAKSGIEDLLEQLTIFGYDYFLPIKD